ncbi:type IV pilin [Ferrimonas balearica DSM 9799]|uniref:Type IV pilin n=1 Tax=Ferrimonas balearica (strain DSM 9799 / CCM 4581 / KCTC 23876 / PAT) TaxID=550540 RepID=E1STR3_FERBD|nr:type IV pilin protein [Ferrimonas balearica]ADN76176.1 type IV pilin [Ferrimonas balearica DSM 9799]
MQKRTIQQAGVTLVELMIVIAILAILTAIAAPSYQQYVLEARRAEAVESLMNAQLLLEEYRITCGSYGQHGTTFASCSNISSGEMSSVLGMESDYYSFALTSSGASYTLTATAKDGQTDDKEGSTRCSPLTLNQSDQRAPTACW